MSVQGSGKNPPHLAEQNADLSDEFWTLMSFNPTVLDFQYFDQNVNGADIIKIIASYFAARIKEGDIYISGISMFYIF